MMNKEARWQCMGRDGEVKILCESQAFDLDKRLWTIVELTVNANFKRIAVNSIPVIALIPIQTNGRLMITRLTARNYWSTLTGTHLG